MIVVRSVTARTTGPCQAVLGPEVPKRRIGRAQHAAGVGLQDLAQQRVADPSEGLRGRNPGTAGAGSMGENATAKAEGSVTLPTRFSLFSGMFGTSKGSNPPSVPPKRPSRTGAVEPAFWFPRRVSLSRFSTQVRGSTVR